MVLGVEERDGRCGSRGRGKGGEKGVSLWVEGGGGKR